MWVRYRLAFIAKTKSPGVRAAHSENVDRSGSR
jgi:hypothetical protein